MSSSRQEINEELEESLLPTEHGDSSAAPFSRQQDDAPSQESAGTEEQEQQEERTANSEQTTCLVLQFPGQEMTVACCRR